MSSSSIHHSFAWTFNINF